ncbi:MAG: transaldolase [Proteobacteria bacterium]|nr:transaldolase [Pseudomonadota bacterium]
MKKFARVEDFSVKIFADGANKEDILRLYNTDYIKGLTTNPTLMKKAGIKNYEEFAIQILNDVKEKPISFEVFADDFDAMERQAMKIAAWGENVYVKIPITNTRSEPSYDLIRKLSHAGVKLNVTAIMTLEQVAQVAEALSKETASVVSVFAGRIADTGRDPVPIMKQAKALLAQCPYAELLWASPRELLNIVHAEQSGCDIITVVPDILSKLSKLDYDLESYSLDTVKMFYDDAQGAGFSL